MQARGNCGKFGCFEFVFPINIVFADTFEVEVESYEELKNENNCSEPGKKLIVVPGSGRHWYFRYK